MSESPVVEEKPWGTLQAGDEGGPMENPKGHPFLRDGGGRQEEDNEEELPERCEGVFQFNCLVGIIIVRQTCESQFPEGCECEHAS